MTTSTAGEVAASVPPSAGFAVPAEVPRAEVDAARAPRPSGERRVSEERRVLLATSALLRDRLRRVTSAKIGRWLAYLVGLAFAGCAIALRAIDGSAAGIEGFVVATAHATAWLGAGMIAYAATHQRSLADRRDGLEVLVAMRGASMRTLLRARFVATALEAGRAVAIPSLAVGILTVALSGTAGVALERLTVLLPVAIFAIATGALLGFLSVLSDLLRPNGGRSLFVALIVLPWAIFDLLGHPGVSVPGFLGAVLTTSLHVLGVGGLA